MPRHQDLQNLFLRFLAERSSVRSYDPDRSVPVEDERRIVEAAQKEPSSFNLQMYSFISVKDREQRRKIAELANKQWFIVDAWVFLVVDAAIVGLTAAFAAESLGYGTCMIGGVRNHVDKMVELLELPRMVYPLFGVCIVYPRKKNPSKQRLPVSGVCFDDVYNVLTVVLLSNDVKRLLIFLALVGIAIFLSFHVEPLTKVQMMFKGVMNALYFNGIKQIEMNGSDSPVSIDHPDEGRS